MQGCAGCAVEFRVEGLGVGCFQDASSHQRSHDCEAYRGYKAYGCRGQGCDTQESTTRSDPPPPPSTKKKKGIELQVSTHP